MCDCYEHPCEFCKCDVPWHIGDWKFPRERFRLWCPRHIGKAPADAVVFYYPGKTDERFTGRNGVYAIAALGPELATGVNPDHDNHPNVGDDEVIVSVSEWRELKAKKIRDGRAKRK
jgi:hypothetical protein